MKIPDREKWLFWQHGEMLYIVAARRPKRMLQLSILQLSVKVIAIM